MSFGAETVIDLRCSVFVLTNVENRGLCKMYIICLPGVVKIYYIFYRKRFIIFDLF